MVDTVEDNAAWGPAVVAVVEIEAVREWLSQIIWRQRHMARAGTDAPCGGGCGRDRGKAVREGGCN